MCLLGFGSYFCFDNPGALQTPIKDAMHISTYQFSNLYAWYSWPNVILPIVGGYLMDSVFGIRLGTIIFAIFICIGKNSETMAKITSFLLQNSKKNYVNLIVFKFFNTTLLGIFVFKSTSQPVNGFSFLSVPLRSRELACGEFYESAVFFNFGKYFNF